MNIVIVGRPNVGKSSLFNRLLGRKRALVLDTPGVTRDRIVEPATFWVAAKEYSVNLIDTGGLGPGQFQEEIRMQVETALSDASIVLFVMDIRAGLTSGDREVWAQLRRAGIHDKVPVIGVLNKADNEKIDEELHEFYGIGADLLMTISAEHALGIDDLKDTIIELMLGTKAVAEGRAASSADSDDEFDEGDASDEADRDDSEQDLDHDDDGSHTSDQDFDYESQLEDAEDSEDVVSLGEAADSLSDDDFASQDDEDEDADEEEGDRPALDSKNQKLKKKRTPAVQTTRPKRMPQIAIIGQPNVGKSTMLNAICGEKRTIVSPIAGTTVDAIDLKINWHGRDFTLVDTAGIRRKNKTEQGIEVLSVVQTRKTLERADLAFLIMDGEKGVYDQDEKIAGLIEEAGVSVILVINKWDTQVNNADFSQKLAEEQVRKQLKFLGYAPIVFTTAKDSLGLDRLFRVTEHLLEARSVRLNTRELTEFIRAEAEVHNPFNAKFYFVHQAGKNPPTFVAHVNDPKKIHFSLSRHLVKAIRAKWGYEGTPIRMHFLKTKNSSEK